MWLAAEAKSPSKPLTESIIKLPVCAVTNVCSCVMKVKASIMPMSSVAKTVTVLTANPGVPVE